MISVIIYSNEAVLLLFQSFSIQDKFQILKGTFPPLDFCYCTITGVANVLCVKVDRKAFKNADILF